MKGVPKQGLQYIVYLLVCIWRLVFAILNYGVFNFDAVNP